MEATSVPTIDEWIKKKKKNPGRHTHTHTLAYYLAIKMKFLHLQE